MLKYVGAHYEEDRRHSWDHDIIRQLSTYIWLDKSWISIILIYEKSIFSLERNKSPWHIDDYINM